MCIPNSMDLISARCCILHLPSGAMIACASQYEWARVSCVPSLQLVTARVKKCLVCDPVLMYKTHDNTFVCGIRHFRFLPVFVTSHTACIYSCMHISHPIMSNSTAAARPLGPVPLATV